MASGPTFALLALGGGVEFLLVLLPLLMSPRDGALAAGIIALLRLCVISRSRPWRWAVEAACRPLTTEPALADCTRVVRGVFLWRILRSYRSCSCVLGSPVG